jgi:hypothetical protein
MPVALTRTENTASPIVELRLLIDRVATVAARTCRKEIMWSVASDFIGKLAVA